MSERDLSFLRERVDGYPGYADESDRHRSDELVRAYAGKRLADEQARVGDGLDPETRAALEAVTFRCMFGDQRFIRHIEHAELDEAALDELLASDRAIVELADMATATDAAGLSGVLAQMDSRFDARRDYAPAPDA